MAAFSFAFRSVQDFRNSRQLRDIGRDAPRQNSLATIWPQATNLQYRTVGRWNGVKSLSFLLSRALRQLCFLCSVERLRGKGRPSRLPRALAGHF